MLETVRLVGRGGCGRVYQGLWCHSPVALKEIYANLADSMDLDDFIKEVNTMAALRHPSCVRLHGISRQGSPPRMTIVMEYLPVNLFVIIHGAHHALGGI